MRVKVDVGDTGSSHADVCVHWQVQTYWCKLQRGVDVNDANPGTMHLLPLAKFPEMERKRVCASCSSQQRSPGLLLTETAFAGTE